MCLYIHVLANTTHLMRMQPCIRVYKGDSISASHLRRLMTCRWNKNNEQHCVTCERFSNNFLRIISIARTFNCTYIHFKGNLVRGKIIELINFTTCLSHIVSIVYARHSRFSKRNPLRVCRASPQKINKTAHCSR